MLTARNVVARNVSTRTVAMCARLYLLPLSIARQRAHLPLITRRALITPPSQQPTPTPPLPQSTPAAPLINGNGRSRWRSFLAGVGRVTILGTLTSAGVFYYFTQKDKHPGSQLPFDGSKKTLVVLGSGWGASSLLKGIDTEDYNVIVVSPRNFFLFTPLLPSVAVGTISPRSIIQPTRYITRHKKRVVSVIEAEATNVDPNAKTVTFEDTSEITGATTTKTIPYDYLVYAVGAEIQTFGIPGVKEHACFMKELHDAEKMQSRFMDLVETAAFPGQTQDEINRLLHVVVVGGGPTGIELSGELHDFLEEDLRNWYPELAGNIRLTLVEALPSVLPMFSKQLIDYTESTFKQSKIEILTKTMVKGVKENAVVMQMPDGSVREVPCGLLVWAGGNKARQVSLDLMSKFPEQTNRRGITVDEHLVLKGSDGSIFAIGDCTATSYAPTAQVASQEGLYLARVLQQIARRDALEGQAAALRARVAELERLSVGAAADKEGDGAKADAAVAEARTELERTEKQIERAKRVRPFRYSHQGSLAYIGSDKAIADLPFFNGNLATGGVATYLFWRSAYISTLFSLRNRVLVASDWLKVKLFGRDVSRD